MNNLNGVSPQDLLLLLSREMPFGKYQGRRIANLPGAYLNWSARKGFPPGEIGRLLALMHEPKTAVVETKNGAKSGRLRDRS